MNATLRLVILLLGLVVLAATARPAQTIEPETLTRARSIGRELTAHYRRLPGRKLVVTDATSTGVVPSVTLMTDWLEPRVVPADNGIYFAVCTARARCPYPARSAAWMAAALLPRRLALELALRAFAATSVGLVVIALPTAEPVWVVFERNDLAGAEGVDSSLLPDVVDRLTRAHMFRPLPILPPPTDTIYAVPLFAP